ncbi:MAG: type I glyceraldehyde-3-phosphate dehydrogenase [Myxococcota bacterium]
MTIKVGINGFGRIGRSVFRILAERDDIEVVAINDIFPNDVLAYLLKYDTIMGTFERNVSTDDDAMYIDGDRMLMTAEREPANLRWKELGVNVVLEATGRFRERADLAKHIAAGADRVLLTVPPKDQVDAMVVMGVNDDVLRPEHAIVSNASCTTNCLAPIAKVLDQTFGIEHGLMTTVHAYTNDQRLADVPHKDLRRSRAAAENIIPTTTGAAKAVGKVLPTLNGKLDGMAARVPVADGSLVDLVVRLSRSTSATSINEAVQQAAESTLQGIVEYNEASVVSSDVVGNPHSSIFDALLTQSSEDGYARVVSWYDNEWGYSNRCVDLIGRLAAL